MNQEPEKQHDIEKHLLNKLPIGDVIICPLCDGETTFLEPDKCMTIYCPNCIFYGCLYTVLGAVINF